MSGQLVKASSLFLPPPVDGLNLITPPPLMKPTEALLLQNFYIFDYGIQTACIPELEQDLSEGILGMYPFVDTSGAAFMLVMTATKCYLYTVATNTLTDKTAAIVFTQGSYSFFYSKGNIFISGGGSGAGVFPLRYDIAAATLNVTGWTGLGFPHDLLQGCNYKNRVYMVYEGSSTFYYGAVDAVSGAMTAVDYSNTELDYGSLVFCTSWSYNQGLTNDELFVLVWSSGNVVVFSGSYPDSDSWEIQSRATIPRPIGRKNFIKLGQDVLIGTERGVVSLKAVFAGNPGLGSSYFVASRNLGAVALKNTEVAFNGDFPFLYWAEELPGGASFGTGGIFVLNYERGAWSKFGFTLSISTLTAMAWSGSKLFMGDETGAIYSVSDPQVDDTRGGALAYYSTPFLDLGNNLKKKMNLLRLLTRMKDGPSAVETLTVYITSDFQTNAYPSTDSATFNPASAVDAYQTMELHPPAVGQRFSYTFYNSGNALAVVEIIGFDAFFETGGVY